MSPETCSSDIEYAKYYNKDALKILTKEKMYGQYETWRGEPCNIHPRTGEPLRIKHGYSVIERDELMLKKVANDKTGEVVPLEEATEVAYRYIDMD